MHQHLHQRSQELLDSGITRLVGLDLATAEA